MTFWKQNRPPATQRSSLSVLDSRGKCDWPREPQAWPGEASPQEQAARGGGGRKQFLQPKEAKWELEDEGGQGTTSGGESSGELGKKSYRLQTAHAHIRIFYK